MRHFFKKMSHNFCYYPKNNVSLPTDQLAQEWAVGRRMKLYYKELKEIVSSLHYGKGRLLTALSSVL